MVNLDMNKLKGHKSFDSYLDEQHGEENSVERKEFEAKAKAWYYAELLKDERKRQNIRLYRFCPWIAHTKTVEPFYHRTSTFHSPIVRLSESKLTPTFTTGSRQLANFDL